MRAQGLLQSMLLVTPLQKVNYLVCAEKTKQSSSQNNQKKQLTFRQFGFPANCRVRNECGKSTLMTCHYPDLGSVVFLIGRAAREICLIQSEALPRSR